MTNIPLIDGVTGLYPVKRRCYEPMSDIKVTTHDSIEDGEVAPRLSKCPISGNYVPYGLAGVVVGECTVLCPACATDEQLDDENGPDTAAIFGNSEWDYPGATCHECGRYLNTNVLVYPNGPGAEEYTQLEV